MYNFYCLPLGRKSLNDELQIKQRYADLTEQFFKVLKKHLDSPSKGRPAMGGSATDQSIRKIPTEVGGINGAN